MVIIAFTVPIMLGLFLMFNGLSKTEGGWRAFVPAIVCMVVSIILFTYSFLGPFDDKTMRVGLSYAAVLFGVLFVLTALTAKRRYPTD
jgi:K+-sensing histidine kinase KdpD